jgi:DNA-binding protein H-NS
MEEDSLKQNIESLKQKENGFKKSIDSLHANQSEILAEMRRLERKSLSDEREALSNMRLELKAKEENIYVLQSKLNDQILKLGIVEGVNK